MMNDELNFDAKQHLYTIRETGEYVPSVTELVKVLLNEYDNVPQSVLSAAAEHGTKVHSLIEYWCKTRTRPEIPPLTFLSNAYKYFEKWAELYQFKPCFSEQRVVYMEQGKPVFAGTLDLVLLWNNRLVLADIKTTAELHTEALQYQLSAYKIALEQMYPALKIEDACCLWLPKRKPAELVRVDLIGDGEIRDAMIAAKQKLLEETKSMEDLVL